MKAFCYVLDSFIELSRTHLKSLQEKEELEKHRATLEEKARPREPRAQESSAVSRVSRV